MDDFITNAIKLLIKFILLVVLLYLGFMMVMSIVDDARHRFGHEEAVAVREETTDEDDMTEVEPVDVPEVEPVAKKKSNKVAKNSPLTMFDEARECVGSNDFKVETIIDGRYVIAKELFKGLEEYGSTTDLTVVFIDNGNNYYTDQVVKIPRGKCARQVGVYKSDHFLYDDKTLPVVRIMD